MTAAPPTIDLNADLGEGFPHDAELLRVVTSANVASGAYTRARDAIQRALAGAAEHGVAVGAHLSYPDVEGFGRRRLGLGVDELLASLRRQLSNLRAWAARVPGQPAIRYVKPHGALYHAVLEDGPEREALAALLDAECLPVLLAPQVAAGVFGVPVFAEGFADRRYLPGGRLAPRTEVGAVLEDDREVAAQAVRLASGLTPKRVPARAWPGPVSSVCVHGDSPSSAVLARAVAEGLRENGFRLRAFAA